MTILRELVNQKMAADKAWQEERLKGCKCPSAKQVNPKCPIHGTGWHGQPEKVTEGVMSVDRFKSLFTEPREKQLWQWAIAKQMNFKEWQEYLEAHVHAELQDRAMDEAAIMDNKQ